jgi:hypothetical protein
MHRRQNVAAVEKRLANLPTCSRSALDRLAHPPSSALSGRHDRSTRDATINRRNAADSALIAWVMVTPGRPRCVPGREEIKVFPPLGDFPVLSLDDWVTSIGSRIEVCLYRRRWSAEEFLSTRRCHLLVAANNVCRMAGEGIATVPCAPVLWMDVYTFAPRWSPVPGRSFPGTWKYFQIL